ELAARLEIVRPVAAVSTMVVASDLRFTVGAVSDWIVLSVVVASTNVVALAVGANFMFARYGRRGGRRRAFAPTWSPSTPRRVRVRPLAPPVPLTPPRWRQDLPAGVAPAPPAPRTPRRPSARAVHKGRAGPAAA